MHGDLSTATKTQTKYPNPSSGGALFIYTAIFATLDKLLSTQIFDFEATQFP